MAERKVGKETMIPESGFVKMELGEIAMKQELGWSYIKMGY